MARQPDFPTLEEAVQEAARLVQSAWIAAAASEPLSERERGIYIAGLTAPASLVYPDGGDPLAARVVQVSEASWRYEYGWATYHLPARIKWAQARSARRGKRGWYMVVPFTHAAYRGQKGAELLSPSTRQSMLPSSVYQRARRLGRRQYLTSGPGGGQAVHAPGMQPYYPRLVRNIRLGYSHAPRQERLVRRPGTKRGQSTYLTFRTISQSSPNWWIPGRQGLYLRDKVERDTAPLVRRLIETGVRQDIDAALRSGLED